MDSVRTRVRFIRVFRKRYQEKTALFFAKNKKCKFLSHSIEILYKNGIL